MFLWAVRQVLGNDLIGEDSLHLLQASIRKTQTIDFVKTADKTGPLPGTADFTITFGGRPNPNLIKNDGQDCLELWGKRFNQISGESKTCADVPALCGQQGSQSQAPYFLEQCCPGACSKAPEMNPIKFIIENKLEDEVRCLSRYGNYVGQGGLRGFNTQLMAGGDWMLYTCDMRVLKKQGWMKNPPFPDGAFYRPNMRKLDGTWVYKECWDEERVRHCCPKQCAGAEPSSETEGIVDKSKYQDPPVWKSPEYDFYHDNTWDNGMFLGKWHGKFPKQYEWKGDVLWYSSKSVFALASNNQWTYGLPREFGNQQNTNWSSETVDKLGGPPHYEWAGGIRCEDIPKISQIGYRKAFYPVNPNLSDTFDHVVEQFAEVYSFCTLEIFAIACPGICGWTVCGAPDVGGAGNAAIPCEAQKQFVGGSFQDLPRTPYDFSVSSEKSHIEVGPGTPTPAPGLQFVNPPSPGATTPTTTPIPGTDNLENDTAITDKDCFDAEIGFGPDFSCANTDMYCGQDSGDGITVGMCCPDKCKQENERKKKNEKEATRKENIKERRQKRKAKDESRRKAERERKKKNKETEWNKKRRLKETENKNKEDERKKKRGWKEALRKKERGWKQNRREKSEKANKRERSRKEKRNKDKPGLEGQACFASKPAWGPSYYCAVAVDSCGGEDDDTIIDCCPAACPPTTAGPGEECFAKSESDWPGVWHCDVLPGVKNYCGCGDKYEAKVKECCPSMCIPTDTCGGFEGKKPGSPKAGELKRKEKRGKAEKTRKGKWGAMREKKIKQEKKNKAANGGKREKNKRKEKSKKESRQKKKGSRKKR